MEKLSLCSPTRRAATGCALAALAGVTMAIGNGVPDGNAHPNVGLLAVEFQQNGGFVQVPVCSGSYAGPRLGAADEHVFMTAGHCVAWVPGSGMPASQLVVTFESTATVDPVTFRVIGATDWFRASDIAFLQTDGHENHGNFLDYGVVVLENVPAGLVPVQLPTAGLLDELAAGGGMRGEILDNVGYGVVPFFKGGPPGFAPPPGRMFSTSLFKGLTKSYLKVNMNSDAADGNGGTCFGDSGSPTLLHRTNVAVAMGTTGDPICRAESANARIDTPMARAFYGQFLALP